MPNGKKVSNSRSFSSGRSSIDGYSAVKEQNVVPSKIELSGNVHVIVSIYDFSSYEWYISCEISLVLESKPSAKKSPKVLTSVPSSKSTSSLLSCCVDCVVRKDTFVWKLSRTMRLLGSLGCTVEDKFNHFCPFFGFIRFVVGERKSGGNRTDADDR